MARQLKITLIKSPHGRLPKQRRILDALGLRKTNRTVYKPDNPQTWGMVNKIPHLLVIEGVDKDHA
ncbi:MAG: 50S ribosomal protein L30 [bacterium]